MSHEIPRQSLFIVIEGIDFSGKTTLVSKIQHAIQNDQLIKEYFDQVIYTKEPNHGVSDVCQQTRSIAIDNESINDLTRGLLFFANRSEHVSKLIQPARDRGGCLIICDRFYLSTLVYQIKKRQHLLEWARVTQKAISPKSPDLTYFIKINKELFLARYRDKNRDKNYLDKLTYEAFEEVSNLYERFINDTEDPNIGPIVYLESLDGEVDAFVSQIQSDIHSKIRSFESR